MVVMPLTYLRTTWPGLARGLTFGAVAEMLRAGQWRPW
jgi:hypothetical protein